MLVEQRYHAVMEVPAAGVPVVEVAERYGVSRKTVHALCGDRITLSAAQGWGFTVGDSAPRWVTSIGG